MANTLIRNNVQTEQAICGLIRPCIELTIGQALAFKDQRGFITSQTSLSR